MPDDTLPLEIDAESVRDLRAAGAELVFLDCREPDERAIASIAGTILIPMREIPERLGQLEPHRAGRVVVHCHHGVRSLRVAQFLRHQGFPAAQSMTGGIAAWAERIDPATPRY